jgi:hypothetical protein
LRLLLLLLDPILHVLLHLRLKGDASQILLNHAPRSDHIITRKHINLLHYTVVINDIL